MSANTIDLYLTTAQFKKMESQKPFQVTFQQLNGDRPADHRVQIELEKKEMTKLNRNIRNQKGFRFNPTKIIGGGLFDTALNIGKKIASSKMAQNIAKQGLSKAVEYGKNSNNSLISGAANLAGNAVNGAGIFDTAMSLGKKLAKSKIAQDMGKQALSKGLSMAANSNNSLISGAANAAKSITGGKLKKGSQEAKNRMAQIRAMRKTGSGFNFIKTLKKIGNSKELKSIGNIAKKTVLPVALQLAKSNPYTSPLAMGTEAILQSQGVSTTGGKLTKRRITMPELIAESYIRNPYPLEVKGGSFRRL
jgi:hypothetical protein